MNKLTIIGNLTKDPELRTTTTGVNVCSFTVAVNRPRKNGEDQGADYFQVSVWRERGENCAKYLKKGSKVCVMGAVSVRTYTANDGTTRASMEIKSADEVEFLSSKSQDSEETAPEQPKVDQKSGFSIAEADDLPF